MADADRIAIVTAGVVTPIGQDLDAFWSALVTGASGISRIERFPVDDLRVGRAGEIKKLVRERGDEVLTDCRASRLLIAAADELVTHVGGRPLAPDPRRVALVLGTALGGVEEGERSLHGERRPSSLAGALYDSPARTLAEWLGVEGPLLTISTACASGATALGVAADLLRNGAADVAVAGGYDVLCRFVMKGFDVLRSLTRDEVRPFDRRRSGLLLGEGAGLVLMERERDAAARGGDRLGHLLGHTSASDGSHISAPDPNGRGLEVSIHGAMRHAGISPEEIEFVSAHGTGTPLNDKIETAVLKRVLGRRAYAVPVTSTKAHTGHTMGAAATLEAIMCLLAWRHGQIPHTLNLEQPDPDCDLDFVSGEPRPCRPRISLSTSLGFGGCNAALILEGA